MNKLFCMFSVFVQYVIAFQVDETFWGNTSRFMKPFIIQLDGITSDDDIYATQALSNFNQQCSTSYTSNTNDGLAFVVMLYFDDYDYDIDQLKASNVNCNMNWPMIFLFRNSSSGTLEMIRPKSFSSHISQEEYLYTIETLFMNGTLDNTRKRFGTFETPFEMTGMSPLSCDSDNSLTYNDVVTNAATVCNSLNSLSGVNLSHVCDLNIDDIDGLNSFASDVPELGKNSFHPIYRPTKTIKDICVTTCATVSKMSEDCLPPSPSPPPPSPPPPLAPEVPIICNNDYEFYHGWNSFALVGDEVTYSNTGGNTISFTGAAFAQFESSSDYILNASFFSGDFNIDVNVNNAFRVFALESVNMTTACDASVDVQCAQIVQVEAGISSFGIRSSNGVSLNALTFSPYDPLEGDIIQNDNLFEYQMFVYWHSSWRNVSGTPYLNPYIGYFYHTTRSNSFLMNVC